MITIEIVVGAVVHGAVDVLCQCQATVRGRLTFVRYSAVQCGTVRPGATVHRVSVFPQSSGSREPDTRRQEGRRRRHLPRSGHHQHHHHGRHRVLAARGCHRAVEDEEAGSGSGEN